MIDLYLLGLAAAPISEARGAIIYGLSMGMNPALVFTCSVLINIAIIPVLFWFLKFAGFRKFVYKIYGNRITKKIEKNKHLLEKYGALALMLFVAVPLPITGAYTGVVLADAVGFDRKKATLFISIGVVIAAVLVFLGFYGVISIFSP